MKNGKVIVIGGGPAGMAAAVSCFDKGVSDVEIFERDDKLGGVLNQCIHNGFGLMRFKENLTGPEYAGKLEEEVKKRNIPVRLKTTVLAIGKDKTVTAINEKDGVFTVQASAIILAMGCRERSKGALNIAGTRPAGIFSAGTAQRYVNIEGYLPGKDVVILGSGDIGLIMARRMTLEGAKVHAVCEIMPFSSGLKRNIVQCLDDFGIPLYLNHTIVKIEGEKRVTGVVIAEVNPKDKKPIAGTEMHIAFDTVLFSVGLIPENELTEKAGILMSPRTKGAVVNQYRETDVEGVFACGNVLHVHDLVDYAWEEAEIAGSSAAAYAMNVLNVSNAIDVTAGDGVSYVLPQRLSLPVQNVKLFFRVREQMKNVEIVVSLGDTVLLSRKKATVTPGEMETLILPTLPEGKEKELTVRIIKGEN